MPNNITTKILGNRQILIKYQNRIPILLFCSKYLALALKKYAESVFQAYLTFLDFLTFSQNILHRVVDWEHNENNSSVIIWRIDFHLTMLMFMSSFVLHWTLPFLLRRLNLNCTSLNTWPENAKFHTEVCLKPTQLSMIELFCLVAFFFFIYLISSLKDAKIQYNI